MSGVGKTREASSTLMKKVIKLQEAGEAPMGEGTETEGMTLTPILKIQMDQSGQSILLKDKGSYLQETNRREDVLAFTKILGLKPLGKAYCRILFEDGKDGGEAIAHVIPGYSEEQWDAIEEQSDITLEDLPPGTLTIVNERVRQLLEEGWEPEHDLQYTNGELLAAAMNYLEAARIEIITGKPYKAEPPLHDVVPWPWDMKWWKPDGPARNVEKGGALVCAMADAAHLNAAMKNTADFAGSLEQGNIGGLLGALLSGMSQMPGVEVKVIPLGDIKDLEGDPEK